MPITIISSATMGGVQFSDSLTGGGAGCNLGTSEAGKVADTKLIFVRHSGIAEITDLKCFLKNFSQAYGGDYSSSSDLAKALTQGDNGYGVQIDFNRAGLAFASYNTFSNSLGSNDDNAITIPTTCIRWNDGGVEKDPSTPLGGVLGASSQGATKGNFLYLRLRWMVPKVEGSPGRRQIDLGFIFNFTT